MKRFDAAFSVDTDLIAIGVGFGILRSKKEVFISNEIHYKINR